MVPDARRLRPGPNVHRSGRARGDRLGLQPGHLTHGEPPAGDDRRLPRAEAHALGLGDEIGSIEPGKQADLAIWSVPTHKQIPYWPGADLVRAVVKRGQVVLDRSLEG
jgi:cytosine/adenosine deaminase-related metal-dependent hydrolase